VFARGSVNAVDYPTRQAFVMELVGAGRVVNAVSLNSVLVHSARIIGPAIAGVLIATVGVAPCFALNAASFVVMIAALASMDPEALRPSEIGPSEPGAIRAALRYVRATPELWIPLALMAAVGTLGFNFQAILPLLARFTFDGGPTAYAALVSAMGLGAVAGALANGARGRVSPGLLAGAAIGFGALALLAAGAPSMAVEVAVLAPLGAASVTLAASVNSALQLASDPAMRGRVMALYSIVFLGSTPIGGPLVGWLSDAVDPRAALVLAGVAGIVAGTLARTAFARAAIDERGLGLAT
jgi:MFS family permease